MEEALDPGVLRYRIAKVEELAGLAASRAQLSDFKATVDSQGQEIHKAIDAKADQRDVEDLAKDLKSVVSELQGLRKTLMGFVITIATASVTVSLTLILTAGAHG